MAISFFIINPPLKNMGVRQFPARAPTRSGTKIAKPVPRRPRWGFCQRKGRRCPEETTNSRRRHVIRSPLSSKEENGFSHRLYQLAESVISIRAAETEA